MDPKGSDTASAAATSRANVTTGENGLTTPAATPRVGEGRTFLPAQTGLGAQAAGVAPATFRGAAAKRLEHEREVDMLRERFGVLDPIAPTPKDVTAAAEAEARRKDESIKKLAARVEADKAAQREAKLRWEYVQHLMDDDFDVESMGDLLIKMVNEPTMQVAVETVVDAFNAGLDVELSTPDHANGGDGHSDVHSPEEFDDLIDELARLKEEAAAEKRAYLHRVATQEADLLRLREEMEVLRAFPPMVGRMKDEKVSLERTVTVLESQVSTLSETVSVLEHKLREMSRPPPTHAPPVAGGGGHGATSSGVPLLAPPVEGGAVVPPSSLEPVVDPEPDPGKVQRDLAHQKRIDELKALLGGQSDPPGHTPLKPPPLPRFQTERGEGGGYTAAGGNVPNDLARAHAINALAPPLPRHAGATRKPPNIGRAWWDDPDGVDPSSRKSATAPPKSKSTKASTGAGVRDTQRVVPRKGRTWVESMKGLSRKRILDLESDLRDAYDGHFVIDLDEIDPEVWESFAPRYGKMEFYVTEGQRRVNRRLPDHLKSVSARDARSGVVRINRGG